MASEKVVFGFDAAKPKILDLIKLSREQGNVATLEAYYNALPGSDADKRNAVDLALREFLSDCMLKNWERRGLGPLESYVDLSVDASRAELCSATMPVVLLSDAFDALTLDECEMLFSFVEKGVAIWKEEFFFQACKNNLLRMCNDLLRRLSRSQNTVFCGRILLFLAKFFPFSERSGLNIISEFNLDNVTVFGKKDDSDLKDILNDKEDNLEEGEVGSSGDTGIKIDYNLYHKFWALQDFFRNPNQCYTKLPWKTFISYSADVLSAFGSFKLDDVGRKNTDASRLLEESASTSQQYFAKYLTSQKLLELQLSDSNFRRYVLLQFLILFQYLNSQVKFKQDSQLLGDEQSGWVRETTERIYRLIEETPPDGPAFAKAVRHILSREEHWNSWKNEGCPEFQKPVPPAAGATSDEPPEEGTKKKKGKKRPLGDQIKDAVANKKYAVGRNELVRLWNLSPNNLRACRSKERDFLPTLEAYFDEPANKKVNDGNFGWRALRLLARRSPHFFTHSNNPINRLPDYLETMIKKIAKDLPTQNMDDTKQDSLENEVVQEVNAGVMDEEELLKPDDKKDMGSDDGGDDKVEHGQVVPLTLEHVTQLAANLRGDDWKKLAKKLSFKSDEVEFFESQRDQEGGQSPATAMLQVWFEQEEDPTVEEMLYILEGLGLQDAAQGVF